MTTNKIDYIYLIHTREFYNHNELIYKIGKTTKLNYCRFNQYPNGSVLLCQIVCNDCDICETKLLKHFKSKYKQRKEIGTEYFEGDYTQMIADIFNIVSTNNDVKKIDTKEEIQLKIIEQKKKIVKENTILENIKILEAQQIEISKQIEEAKKIVESEKIKTNNIINKTILTHRKCTNVNCLQEFKYPSGLKRHYELSALCKKKPDEIKVCFSGLKERQPQKYKCDICNTLYTKKSSLTRHLLNSKCNIS